jgi:hypothetical protein
VDEATGRTHGTMLDVCGRAWIEFSGKGKNRTFLTAFRKLGEDRSVRDFTGGTRRGRGLVTTPLGRISLGKGYPTGFRLSFFDLVSGPACQYMSINEAAHRAALDYFKSQGLLEDAYIGTWID